MTTAAGVFVALLVAASVTVTVVSTVSLKPLRMTGPAVRRLGGYLLTLVGAWFIVLAALSSPFLLR
jgi:hypothetical protein